MAQTAGQPNPTPAAKIALVTDSTCDLRETESRRYVSAVVPLHVTVAGISYLDRVDLQSSEFYKLFRQTNLVAHSSQPSVGEFAAVYQSLLDAHDAIVSVHIAGRLSGTVNTATMAAETVDPARIRVVDSHKVSAGVGLVVQTAGEAIQAGRSLDEVVAATEAAVQQTRVYSTVPSLEAAVRGGRLSARTARLLGLIELKPLIVFDEEGGVHTNGARLGYYRALRATVDRVRAYADGGPARFAVVHADGLEAAEYTVERLRLAFGDVDIPVLEAGAVITTHVGLGTVAIAVQRMGAPGTPASATDPGA